MKFKISRKKLSGLINIANKAVNLTSFVPILTGIFFDIKKDKITLITSNTTLNIKLQEEKNFEVIREGKFILSSKYITDIVKKFNCKIIEFEEIDNDYIKIIGPNIEIKLKKFNIDDFPKIKFMIEDSICSLNLESYTLSEAIKQTVFCTSNDESRPILRGLNFKLDSKENELIITSSDSHRIARKSIKLKEKINDFECIIPTRVMNELNKIMLDNEENKIKIFFSNKKVVFVFKNIIIQSSLIEGKYPDTENLFKSNSNIKINVNRSDLLGAVDRSMLLTKDLDNNLINFKISNEKLVITTQAIEIGEIKEKIEIKSNEIYEEFTITFNGIFLLECLKSLKSNRINLGFKDSLSAFSVNTKEEFDIKHLIVPSRT